MTSATDPAWNAIIATWGHAYTFRHDPSAALGKQYTARPVGADDLLDAATPAKLLDAIKDHASARALTTDPTP